ncbi:MAG: adenine phosphoribosyltransferase [bacterium]|nr:adenine phosphoribosyltransferase [bacterium]
MSTAPADLRRYIRTIPDHPKPGIQFRDITTLVGDPQGLAASIDALAAPWAEASEPAQLVAGIEARGFVFGAPLAARLGVGFLPLRKPGKLPGETIGRDFELEYGTDRIEMHVDAFTPGTRILLVDDLIATGGTAEAAVELLREAGAIVIECAFVVDLPDLGGTTRLEKLGCSVRSLCAFEGE